MESAVVWCAEDPTRTLLDWTLEGLERLSPDHAHLLLRRALKTLGELGSFDAGLVERCVAATYAHDGRRPEVRHERLPGETENESKTRRLMESAVKWCAENSDRGDRVLGDWVEHQLGVTRSYTERIREGLKRPEITSRFTADEIAAAVLCTRLVDGRSAHNKAPNPIPQDRLSYFTDPDTLGRRLTTGFFPYWFEATGADPSNSEHLAAFCHASVIDHGNTVKSTRKIMAAVAAWLDPDWVFRQPAALTKRSRDTLNVLQRVLDEPARSWAAPTFSDEEIRSAASTLIEGDRAYADWCKYFFGQAALNGATAWQIANPESITLNAAANTLTIIIPESGGGKTHTSAAAEIELKVRPVEVTHANRLAADPAPPSFTSAYIHFSDRNSRPPSAAGRKTFARGTSAPWVQRLGLRAGLLIEREDSLRFGSVTTLRATSPHCQELDGGGYKLWTVDKDGAGYKYILPTPLDVDAVTALADYLANPEHCDYLIHTRTSDGVKRSAFRPAIAPFREELAEVVPGLAANSIRRSGASIEYERRENVNDIIGHKTFKNQHLYIETADVSTEWRTKERADPEPEPDLAYSLRAVEALLVLRPPSPALLGLWEWVDELPDRDLVSWVQWRMLDPDNQYTPTTVSLTLGEHRRHRGEDIADAENELRQLRSEGHGARQKTTDITTHRQIAEWVDGWYGPIDGPHWERSALSGWKAAGFLNALWLDPRNRTMKLNEASVIPLLIAAENHACDDPMCLGRWMKHGNVTVAEAADILLDTNAHKRFNKKVTHFPSPSRSISAALLRAAHEAGMFALDIAVWRGYRSPEMVHKHLAVMGLDPLERKNPGTLFPGCTLGHELGIYPSTATPENRRPVATAEAASTER